MILVCFCAAWEAKRLFNNSLKTTKKLLWKMRHLNVLFTISRPFKKFCYILKSTSAARHICINRRHLHDNYHHVQVIVNSLTRSESINIYVNRCPFSLEQSFQFMKQWNSSATVKFRPLQEEFFAKKVLLRWKKCFLFNEAKNWSFFALFSLHSTTFFLASPCYECDIVKDEFNFVDFSSSTLKNHVVITGR